MRCISGEAQRTEASYQNRYKQNRTQYKAIFKAKGQESTELCGCKVTLYKMGVSSLLVPSKIPPLSSLFPINPVARERERE